MNSRRRSLLALGGLTALTPLFVPKLTREVWAESSADYRAIVVLFLYGGNDGHNTLVPLDGGYDDYELARRNLKIPKASLVALPGRPDGRSFGMHDALRPLLSTYSSGRLGFIANVGALVEPATGRQVRDRAVQVPPFLFSHSDQTLMAQGWIPSRDASGWAGRALEALPARLVHDRQAVAADTARTLVQGRERPVTYLSGPDDSWWGVGNLRNPGYIGIQTLKRLAQLQSNNDYEAEYARTADGAITDATHFVDVYARARLPGGTFGGLESLRNIAAAMPIFKADGLRRQVFLVPYGAFDTHANQRGTEADTQDAQLAKVGQALADFDAANIANGLGDSVITLVMSEFGRTVRPGSGGGSEHGWGNHWMVMGGAVRGGTVHGRFPSLALGSDDDGDDGANGRHVPSISTDQVAATLMLWMGMEPGRLLDAFPYLEKFPDKTLPSLLA